jgi:hypothetical protein
MGGGAFASAEKVEIRISGDKGGAPLNVVNKRRELRVAALQFARLKIELQLSSDYIARSRNT